MTDESKNARSVEQARVEALLKRDADDREWQRRHDMAVTQVENGEFANLDDTVVPPTPEQLAKGDFVAYTPKGNDNTVRSVKTVRRLLISTVDNLFRRGVIDADQYRVCLWYRERFDGAQIGPSPSIQSYGESMRGDPVYGHLPRTEWGVQSRRDYRWASSFLPNNLARLFDLVVLQDMTLKLSATFTQRGYERGREDFRKACDAMHSGIKKRLDAEKPARRMKVDDEDI